MNTTSQTGLDDAIIEILHLATYTKRASLRQQLTARGYYLADRLLRKHVEYLITDGQYCIASSEKGYSLITTSEQLDSARKYLQKKAFSIHARIKCLEDNFKLGKLTEQLQLFS